MKRISIGIVGTSWWSDAMYLPALQGHPNARVISAAGRDLERAREFANRWSIPRVYDEYRQMIDREEMDAVIVATSNDSHYPITMKALGAGLHVLCEKPLALTYTQAAEMAALADKQGVKHMVPFTYRHMPSARYIKELLDEGYIGRPYHLNMRYYSGYGRTPEYRWRFDVARAGSGAIGDIGSHFLYLARWYFGEINGVSCRLGRSIEREKLTPDGRPYEVGDDSAIITLSFANGALGVVHASTLAYEESPFGQTHHMEFHGSEGTLYHFIDWDKIQRVSGARVGQGMVKELPIPEHIWGGVRRDTVQHTYHDVFRRGDFMARQFVTGIVEARPVSPDFHDGARVQQLIEAAIQSDQEGRWIEV